MTAPILAGLYGDQFEVTPTPESCERAYFDNRANRALRGTLTGESMAYWGEFYVKEAKALLDGLSGPRGTLWARVAE